MRKLSFAVAVLIAACEQKPTQPAPEALRDIVGGLAWHRYPAAPELCYSYTYVTAGFGDNTTGGPSLSFVECRFVKKLLPPEERRETDAEAPPKTAP